MYAGSNQDGVNILFHMEQVRCFRNYLDTVIPTVRHPWFRNCLPFIPLTRMYYVLHICEHSEHCASTPGYYWKLKIVSIPAFRVYNQVEETDIKQIMEYL